MSNQVKEGISDSEQLRNCALFDDVSGLAVRSKVVIAGIPVGRVDKLNLTEIKPKFGSKLIYLALMPELLSDRLVCLESHIYSLPMV